MKDKVRNTFYYYKSPILFSIIIIAIAIFLIVPIVIKGTPDLKVFIAGENNIEDVTVLEDRIEKDVPTINAASVKKVIFSGDTGNPSNPGDYAAQMDTRMHIKFVTEIAAGQNDVYILDEAHYKEIAEMDGVKPVEEVLGDLSKLGIDLEKTEDLKIVVRVDEGEPANEPKIYGVDVSDSKILRESGLQGERFIAAFGHQGEFTDSAIAFVKKLLE